MERTKIEVTTGFEPQDFAIGDYLNAINEVTCWFQAQRMAVEEDLATALRLYAKVLEEG